MLEEYLVYSIVNKKVNINGQIILIPHSVMVVVSQLCTSFYWDSDSEHPLLISASVFLIYTDYLQPSALDLLPYMVTNLEWDNELTSLFHCQFSSVLD